MPKKITKQPQNEKQDHDQEEDWEEGSYYPYPPEIEYLKKSDIEDLFKVDHGSS